jgi:hypothetical protein
MSKKATFDASPVFYSMKEMYEMNVKRGVGVCG